MAELTGRKHAHIEGTDDGHAQRLSYLSIANANRGDIRSAYDLIESPDEPTEDTPYSAMHKNRGRPRPGHGCRLMRVFDLRLQAATVRRKPSDCDLTAIVTLESDLRILAIAVGTEVHRCHSIESFGLRMRFRYAFTMGLSC